MKVRALVLDDSRIMRKMVMESLMQTELADFQFTEAMDGAEGLAKFDPACFDILFVDWNMPNMSGIDFVRKVRSMPATRHIVIVMVTSEKTMGKVMDALDNAGANEYICKPFTLEELSRKLKTLIEGIVAKSAATKPEKQRGFFSKLVS